ncbi:methyl-accepting chemotaxis protein [Blastochloris viridis]|uniref:Methyl-accepting chemotaxis protein n=1 Tax=Blastochloris viridis TaxID=1079 RepID=A0A0H5BFG7_BLAVI|nr:HAMP domain-containing methyl-accepting chemotaxis protein [Blastochloris viridis]ALK10919.1 Methyl-accepting chemotaxis protein 4 [Blastochloris viridis]BAR99101.1 methyl-accepting chemotaxis protein [Blastochloris viridis]CUU43581.1 Methyl-accepting chemotaxis protein 4 [Blastochloris viridis]
MQLKIGQKLAVSAALGMALVVSLIVLSRVALEDIDETTDTLDRAGHVVTKLVDVKLALRDTRALFYQAISTPSANAINDAIAAADRIGAPLSEQIAQLAAQAALAANRERLARAKPLVESYLAGWREGVVARRDMIEARARLIALVASWRSEFARLEAVAARLGPDAAAAAARVDGHVADARAGIWRFFATEDAELKSQVDRGIDAAVHDLRALEAKDAPQIAAAAATLAKLAEQHRALFETSRAAIAKQATTIATIAPMRVEVTRLVDESLEAASKLEAKLNADVHSAVAGAARSGLAIGALTALVMAGAAVFGFAGVGRPIRRIAGVLDQLAEGDKTVDIPFTTRGDEVGDTARAAQVFKDNLIRMDQMTAEQREAEARAEAEKRAAMHQLAVSFEGAVGGIIEAVSSAASQLQGAAQTMSAAADQTNRQSTAVASASEEASSNVQTVASAAEELSASVSEIGRRVNESARIAAEAAKDADETASKVGRLSQAAQKIGDIVGLISTIAGQTNLLALNATIEAARAGDAGRGFAVVASEVKSLADQTAKATAEISAQIEEIQSSTADSAHAIGQITEIIRRMNEIATTIASAVEEQGAATTEIARNVQQASAGTAEVSSNIVGVTRAAADSSAASTQVLAAAGDLAIQSGVLKAEVGKFLATVRVS